ncbi:MAG TPA: SDR family NAD(P)-dependent oxidoreductase [Arachidicoccus sp.]
MGKKTWYITGASKGFGLALVKRLLGEGHKVAATSRNKERLQNAVNIITENFLPLEVNLRDEASIRASIKQTHETFGNVDVIINNAGYGIFGAVEELSSDEILQSVDINLLAAVFVVKHSLPYLRAQHCGHIINISSIGGFAVGTGRAMYSASKYAVIGLSEALAQDVKELNIKVTAIAPGTFRTSFLAGDSLVVAQNKIEDYKTVHNSEQRYADMNGKQIGDPELAVKVIMDIAENPEPPAVLFIGSDAYNRASKKIEEQRDNLEKYKTITLSTDF